MKKARYKEIITWTDTKKLSLQFVKIDLKLIEEKIYMSTAEELTIKDKKYNLEQVKVAREIVEGLERAKEGEAYIEYISNN